MCASWSTDDYLHELADMRQQLAWLRESPWHQDRDRQTRVLERHIAECEYELDLILAGRPKHVDRNGRDMPGKPHKYANGGE